MPRSNKKKKCLNQRAVPVEDEAIAHLLSKERAIMISRAVVRFRFIVP